MQQVLNFIENNKDQLSNSGMNDGFTIKNQALLNQVDQLDKFNSKSKDKIEVMEI